MLEWKARNISSLQQKQFFKEYKNQKELATAFIAEWSKAPDLRPGIVLMRGFEPH